MSPLDGLAVTFGILLVLIFLNAKWGPPPGEEDPFPQIPRRERR